MADIPEDMPDNGFRECELRIGYIFNDPSLLKAAMTHASGADHRLASNERLEFFGDAILGMVICEYLYDTYPEEREGELTQVKSAVVSRQTCARIGQSLGLDDFLILGRGMSGRASVPSSLLANVVESLIAAVYIDGGLDTARNFVLRYFEPEIERIYEGTSRDNYKSVLQQYAQKEYNTTPSYRLLDEKGPDHSKCFKIGVRIGSQRFQAAWGRNKKEAEQRAAKNAICQIEGNEPPYPSD